MIKSREIKRWCERVAREFRPEKIVLFGSYAQGTPTEDSDVDVLVVMPLPRGQRDVRQAAAIRERVRASFPMDVIVRSPRLIARRKCPVPAAKVVEEFWCGKQDLNRQPECFRHCS